MHGSDCNCGGDSNQGDSRIPLVSRTLALLHPVLGPTLGGGFSGSGIGSGFRVGGGLVPAVLNASSPDPLANIYPLTRVDIHFDYSTPKRLFEREWDHDPALNREFGGLQGGQGW